MGRVGVGRVVAVAPVGAIVVVAPAGTVGAGARPVVVVVVGPVDEFELQADSPVAAISPPATIRIALRLFICSSQHGAPDPVVRLACSDAPASQHRPHRIGTMGAGA
jgi:hypothetical protein